MERMRLMPEILLLRYGGVGVRTRAGGPTSEAAIVFEARVVADPERPLVCHVRHGGGPDISLLPQEVRLLSDQLRLLADSIDAEEAYCFAEARKREALRRLKDGESNG